MGDIKQIQYDIEEVTSDKAGNYYIKGWCILKNVRYGYFNYGNNKTSSNVYNNMHLCIIDANKVYILPTKLEKRQDVNEFINDGIDYKYCGYRAKLNNNYISLISEHSWRIILKNIDGEESIYFLAEQSK